jgi:hypothetical protein
MRYFGSDDDKYSKHMLEPIAKHTDREGYRAFQDDDHAMTPCLHASRPVCGPMRQLPLVRTIPLSS